MRKKKNRPHAAQREPSKQRAGKIALGTTLRAPFGCAVGLELRGLKTLALS